MPTVETALPIVFQHYVPRPPLTEFVGLFWYWKGHQRAYSKERLLPMGTIELVIDVSGRFNAPAGISGPHSEAFIIERRSQDELLGIHFHPGGIFPFVDFPCGVLHGLHISLAELWGEREANDLVCRLHEAPTVDSKFVTLERWLWSVARRPVKRHAAVDFALREFRKDAGLSSSALMADRVGFSQRRFIQLFRDEVGLTPKLYSRIRRFQKVIQVVQKREAVRDWVDVALECGYFDQSHFNHDFREFAGLTPTEYLELRTPHTNHVQVL
jgi:AraC-like DNA-binding protein